MKPWQSIFSFFLLILICVSARAEDWPKTITTSTGSQIKMYEPQPESFSGNLLKAKAAVSILEKGKKDPVFGLVWAEFTVSDAGNSQVNLNSLSVTNIKFPGESDDTKLMQLKSSLETEIPRQQVTFSRSDVLAKLDANTKETNLAGKISSNPPKIIYSKKPSILVLVDGQPDLQENSAWGVQQVVNTPFTIVKNNDQQFFLYGAKKWYTADQVTGPWRYIDQVPAGLEKMDKEVRESDTTTLADNNDGIADIIVSTEPAELIQSQGEANFAPIEGTGLLYMTNTGNDIFLDISSQQYYVLVSGRWFKAPNLTSKWTYISPEKLPADFAKIPENSPKENVLVSVAGTDAANESVLDAQLPQTAKVDRKNASANVTYDGDPKFENIEGTNLQYAVNTPGSVLRDNKRYYYVENGVWFESNSANGPWMVSTQRPDEVQYIPPAYPVYNVKYVYIYEATPDYVYMGYTPGYLGNYIYGPTIVYGTGYYYHPWRGRYYYPRPCTWGFGMQYNPWTGWGFGLNMNVGWFNIGIGNYGGFYSRGFRGGGWWGPPVYRPPYFRAYNRYSGRNVVINNYNIINRSNNIYRYRRDVVTHDRPAPMYYRNGGIVRPTSYSNGRNYTGNNGRFNGNRATDQRPGGVQGDRQVSRNSRLPYNTQSAEGRVRDQNQGSMPADRQISRPNRMNYDQQRSQQDTRGQAPGATTPDRQTTQGNRIPYQRERSAGGTPVQPQPGTAPAENRSPADQQRTGRQGNWQRGGGERPNIPSGSPALPNNERARPDRPYQPAQRQMNRTEGAPRPQQERPARENNQHNEVSRPSHQRSEGGEGRRN